MADESGWVTLYNPSQQAWHRVPDNAAVIRDFQDRGWYTPEESAAHAEEEAAAAAEALKGKALDDAAKKAGIPTSLSADEKRARLAELEQAESATPTKETEGEQV
jgi:hypothetical protein